MTKELPSIDLLHKVLRCDSNAGKLFWRARPASMFNPRGARSADGCQENWNSRYANAEAFTNKTTRGYFFGRIFRNGLFAHRVIWAMHHGAWPDKFIDHIDGNSQNNQISNLRCVTHQENMRNAKMPKTNTSGVVGVTWDKSKNKWQAQIRCGSKNIHLGRYTCIALASCVREVSALNLGFHENHGQKRDRAHS